MDIKSGITRVSPTTIIDTSARRDFTEWGGPVMSWQPGGRRLAVCSSVVEVALLDTDSLEVLSTFKAHKNLVFSMAFSADSRWLATGSMDNTIRVTDIAAKPAAAVATMRGHAGWVRTLRFSPDGSLLASWCKEDRTLRLWDTRTGNLKGVFESDGADVSFLPDGQTLISGDVRAVHLWDVRSAEGWVLRGHRGFDISVLVSPDGGTIYSGGWDGWSGQPGSLRFWDAATGDQIAAMGAADVYVRGATLSLDGSRLAVSFRSSKG
ncbi:MAG: hypothetical protein NT154_02355, partial [Verrucomicrobia bacterium]|nr:hypothetical protein [Verrucomicrobiota bacterium]